MSNHGYTYEKLEELAGRLVACLIEKIESGRASAADLSVAVTLLRDNRILATSRESGVEALSRSETAADVDLDQLPPPSEHYADMAAARSEEAALKRTMKEKKRFH